LKDSDSFMNDARIKSIRTTVFGMTLMVFVACTFRCAKDYNPFETISNAQVHVASESCSQRVRDNDTLLIFTTETLAVYTTVREKIDSIKFHADNNRLHNDFVLYPPYSSDVIDFLLSFSDTGSHVVTVTAFRSDKSMSSVGPLTFYVRSPLKQNDIDTALGASLTLSTPGVGDDDVYYVWVFGTAANDTIKSTFHEYLNQYVLSVPLNKTLTGALFVSDTNGICSPISPFSFRFFQPQAPIIRCTDKGLSGDTIVTGDSSLLFTVQIIDSSHQGLLSVQIAGANASTSDGTNFSLILSGMERFSETNKKEVKVVAVNKLNDTTTDTFYCYYNSAGPHPGLIKLTLVNPTSSITTSLRQIPFLVNVTNPDLDSVTMKVYINGQLITTSVGNNRKNAASSFTDEWLLNLAEGAKNDVVAEAWVGTLETDTTSIAITQSQAYVDATGPEIIKILINGQQVVGENVSVPQTTKLITDSIYAVDNESGIDSAYITVGVSKVKYTLTADLNSTILWSTKTNIPFLTAGSQTLTIRLVNNAKVSTVQLVTVTKQ
jgi:hypothetical protein